MKATVKGIEMQATDRQKIFTKYVSGKRFISDHMKNFQNSIMRKQPNSKKQAKGLNQCFIKEDT